MAPGKPSERTAPPATQPAGLRLAGLSGPLLGLLVVLGVFIALVLAKSGLAGLLRFLSVSNAQVLVHDNTIPAVVALGMLLIMISGGIDLSVGSVVALVTVVTMWVYRLVYAGPGQVPLLGGLHSEWHGTHSVPLASAAAVVAGVATGGLCGLVNGSVITTLRLSPFVATLGMYSIARGLAFWLSNRTVMTFPGGRPPGWVDALTETSSPYQAGLTGTWALGVLAAGTVALLLVAVGLRRGGWRVYTLAAVVLAAAVVVSFLFFYPGFWSLLLLALGTAALLHFTVLGRYCYAIGSNEATARLCGVPIARNKVVLYTLAGLLTGWAGVLSFAHMSSADPGSSMGLELVVIAAVVIGGASLNGGQGTVLGALIGVLILGILENGVSAFNVPVEVKWILIGVIIIANTALSQWQRRQVA
jgi:ribose/xylose/arabinose/galactoside ABC-type transport system permease subunit